MAITTQAWGVGEVYQGAHRAVVNPPSANVSPHIRAKARAFGRVVSFYTGCFMGRALSYLTLHTDLTERLEKNNALAPALILSTAGITAVAIACNHLLSPGGFIYEHVCASLDAEERQEAS
ncbi:hypothetical protein [Salinisphaera sp. G21_0]|uniref:hypothetical protein n=1 Tax=Salinisphaera sp. G21_0 TaxID=2821094 RepID=UPI001ADB13DB|nr:hypothetical protein [Salinisphaera sp. G21_0]MBO9482895.1 hypothetical protein [Salinisphaera sp. G21_0]